MPALSFILQAWALLPSVIETGMDVMDFYNKTDAMIKKMQAEKRDPSTEEWDALNDMIRELRAQRPDLGKEDVGEG